MSASVAIGGSPPGGQDAGQAHPKLAQTVQLVQLLKLAQMAQMVRILLRVRMITRGYRRRYGTGADPALAQGRR